MGLPHTRCASSTVNRWLFSCTYTTNPLIYYAFICNYTFFEKAEFFLRYKCMAASTESVRSQKGLSHKFDARY